MVRGLGRLVDVEVGEHLLGHVVDGLGLIIDSTDVLLNTENTTEHVLPERKNVERKALVLSQEKV